MRENIIFLKLREGCFDSKIKKNWGWLNIKNKMLRVFLKTIKL